MFRSAEELSLVYSVSAERLRSYAARGNLSMRRCSGELQFDEASVAKLFPKRHGSEPGLGILGLVRLGKAEAETAAD
jgi:hypothetical protein